MKLPSPWFRRFAEPRWIRAIGVVAAGVILAEVNLLGSRHFARFDVTTENLYTLSEPTRALLHDLDGPAEIICLLSRSDPVWSDAKHLLDAYRAESPLLKITNIDPDRDVAAFVALGKQHDIGTEETDTGATVASASFLVRKGEKSWFIRSDQLVRHDEDGHVTSQLESRLSEALARVGEAKRARICFSSGHGESSIEDNGPEGLAELGRRLERSNLEAVRVPLDVPQPEAGLGGCQVIAVVGPDRAFSRELTALLQAALLRHANLLLLLDPVVSSEAQFVDVGLLPPQNPLGVTLRPGFVIERDPTRRLPQGLGESFFAEVLTHPVTRGLSTEEARLDARPVLVGVQALVHDAGGPALPLLKSSPASRVLDDLGRIDQPLAGNTEAFVLASAIELPNARAALSPGLSPHARAVIVGGSNLAQADSFRDPERYGNRVFVESALSWLVDRPRMLSIPERGARVPGLSLTEESLSNLLLYVLLYMPATAALMGSFVILRRRSLEARSRQEKSS